MRIGDEIYVHGFVDEIREGVCIVRNEGGYFGTVYKEILQALPDGPISAEIDAENASKDILPPDTQKRGNGAGNGLKTHSGKIRTAEFVLHELEMKLLEIKSYLEMDSLKASEGSMRSGFYVYNAVAEILDGWEK